VLSEGAGREVEGVSLCPRVHKETHVPVRHLITYRYLIFEYGQFLE
jgi:hypothetical protein